MPAPATPSNPAAPAADVVMAPDTPSFAAPQPAALMDAVAAAIATAEPTVITAPPAGQDPSDAPPNLDPDGVPASTTPDPAAAVPDSAPAVPEADKPKDPALTDPATPPPPGAKPSDEFGDLPADAKADTRERFSAMKSKFDEEVERRTHAEETASRWHETIQSTGTTPEQFGQLLSVATAINSGDPVQLKVAYDAMMGQCAEIAKVMGYEVPGVVDPLADFPDLQARVDPDHDNPIDRNDALEIARARKQQAIQTQQHERQTTVSQQEGVYNQGIAAVSQLGTTMRATDPARFAAALPVLTPIIDSVVASLPPDQWVKAITNAYNALPAPAAPVVARAPNAPTPIRPGAAAGAGGFDKAPSSPLEAMQRELARGR